MKREALSTPIPLRLTDRTLDQVRRLAQQHDRPVSAMLRRLIQRGLEVMHEKATE